MLLTMPSSADLSLAIAPLLLGYVIGWASPRLRQRWRTRRARKFWKPFARLRRLRVIAGGHRGRLDGWEASGLAGIGDVKALTELQDIFVENHLGRLPTTFSTSHNLALIEGMDLILIGGPDANWATLETASRLPGRFTFGDVKDHAISITDRVTGRVYSPNIRVDGVVDQDVGVIKMMPSPFGTDNRIMIIAGAFGYGTLAGVKLTRQKKFLQHPLIANGGLFECLFHVDIVADEPLPAEIHVVYPLATK